MNVIHYTKEILPVGYVMESSFRHFWCYGYYRSKISDSSSKHSVLLTCYHSVQNRLSSVSYLRS
jgi:hypothetical protein